MSVPKISRNSGEHYQTRAISVRFQVVTSSQVKTDRVKCYSQNVREDWRILFLVKSWKHEVTVAFDKTLAEAIRTCDEDQTIISAYVTDSSTSKCHDSKNGKRQKLPGLHRGLPL